MHQVLLAIGLSAWAVAAAAQGGRLEQWQDYRIPAGFVYEGETLTPEQARELPGRNAVLTLLNVKAISAEVAGIIVSPHEPTFLTLPALETDDVGVAAALSFHRGHLRLFGMKRLTPEVAAALVGSPGQSLEIPDVREVSPEAARALADGKRGKVVVGLTSLSTEIAEILAKFKGSLCFPRLETLSLNAAAALDKHRRTLDLGPARITPDVAEVLLRHDARIGLTGVKRLDPGVGDILAGHKSEVAFLLTRSTRRPWHASYFRNPIEMPA